MVITTVFMITERVMKCSKNGFMQDHFKMQRILLMMLRQPLGQTRTAPSLEAIH